MIFSALARQKPHYFQTFEQVETSNSDIYVLNYLWKLEIDHFLKDNPTLVALSKRFIQTNFQSKEHHDSFFAKVLNENAVFIMNGAYNKQTRRSFYPLPFAQSESELLESMMT